MRKPRRLYHSSPRSRRASILRDGLDPAYGARRRRGSGEIAVWTTSERADALAGCEDVWRIDTAGLAVSQHFGEDTWWLVLDRVPPARLSLISTCD